LTSIIEKRRSLHGQLNEQRQRAEELERQISELEGLANLGSATAMIAHEMNNLLTPPANYAELALENPRDEVLREKALSKTVQNCRRASKVAESILALANCEHQGREQINLVHLLDELFACLCRDFRKDAITVQTEVPQELSIYGVGVQIQQVLMNLILNSRDAMLGSGGHLTIKAEESSDAVHIRVSDTGRGISPAELKDIFEPFFSTKKDGSSSSAGRSRGIGLSFCRKVIEAHKGTISVESRLNEGTTFLITLAKEQ